MVFLSLYTKNIKIKYKSTLFSKATFFILLTGIFTIVFSFVIAYNTGGFWLKRATFYEQPKVTLVGDYLLMAETNNFIPVVCSSYPFFKNHLEQYDFCSLIKLREVDYDFDGKNDEVILEISLNLYNFTLNSLYFVLPINYHLKEYCPLKMQSLIIYQYIFNQKVTDLNIYGYLQLFQTNPIICNERLSTVYNSPIIESTSKESKTYVLENIIQTYLQRNITTHLINTYTVINAGNKKTFNLKLILKYPEHQIYYKPGFWQVIKVAWIQYLAVYILLAYLFNKIRKYIFDNRLVWYYEDSPLKNK